MSKRQKGNKEAKKPKRPPPPTPVPTASAPRETSGTARDGKR